MPHFMIVLIPYINLSKISWIIKCLFLRHMDFSDNYFKLYINNSLIMTLRIYENICIQKYDRKTKIKLAVNLFLHIYIYIYIW